MYIAKEGYLERHSRTLDECNDLDTSFSVQRTIRINRRSNLAWGYSPGNLQQQIATPLLSQVKVCVLSTLSNLKGIGPLPATDDVVPFERY